MTIDSPKSMNRPGTYRASVKHILRLFGVVVFASSTHAADRASWYTQGAGTRTAGGSIYRPDDLTCAHKTLAFGTKIKVTHKRTGAVARCVITDRGPFIAGRTLDLSRGTARALGILDEGVADVVMVIE